MLTAPAFVQVATRDASLHIKNFQDPVLASGLFLLHLLDSVRNIVNWSLVSHGGTAEDMKQNTRYAIR
jgi:hypothetical protein